MTHPEEGHSEETSEDLKEETEEISVKETEQVSVEPTEWVCDICNRAQVGDVYRIKGYHERICAGCYDRGLMWCIREAWKWRSQVRIDVLRKPRDG